jgi:hypothetical protein
MADYPTPGRNEFSADEEQAMRQAKAKIRAAAGSPLRDKAMGMQMDHAQQISDSVRGQTEETVSPYLHTQKYET